MAYKDLVLADSPYLFFEEWPTNQGSVAGNAIIAKGSGVSYTDTSAVLDGNNARFTTSSDSAIALSTSVPYSSTTGLTVETWIYARGWNPHAIIFNMQNGATGFLVRLRAPNGVLGVSIGEAQSYNTITTSTTIPLNGWHHVAMTYDPNVATNNVRLYLDGVDVGGGTNSYNGTSWSTTTYNPRIGGYSSTGWTSPDRTNASLNASLDNFAYYGKVLSAATILDHYNYIAYPAAMVLDANAGQSVHRGLDAKSGVASMAAVASGAWTGLDAKIGVAFKSSPASNTWRGLDATRVAVLTKYIVEAESKTNAWTGINATSRIQTDPYFGLIGLYNPIHYWDNWPHDVGSKSVSSTFTAGGWQYGKGINLNGLVTSTNGSRATLTGNVYNPVSGGIDDQQNNYTVEAWIRTDPSKTVTQSTYEPLPYRINTVMAIKRPDDAAGKDYVYHLASNEFGALTLYLTTYDRATGTEVENEWDTVLGGYENRLKWTHFAVTDDGKTYLNGQLVHSTAGTHTHFGSGYTQANSNITVRFGDGSNAVDNVAIFPSRLSQAVIQSHADFYNGRMAGSAKSQFKAKSATAVIGKIPAYVIETLPARIIARGLGAVWGAPPLVLRTGPVRTQVRGLNYTVNTGLVLKAESAKSYFNFGRAEIASKTKSQADAGNGVAQFKVIQPTYAPSALPSLEQQIADYPMFYAAEPSLNKKLDNFGLKYSPDINCGTPDFSISGIVNTNTPDSVRQYFFSKEALEGATGWFHTTDVVDNADFGKAFKFKDYSDIVVVAPTASTYPVATRSNFDGRQTRNTKRPKGFVTEFWFKSEGPQDHMQMLAGYFYAGFDKYTESVWVDGPNGQQLSVEELYRYEPYYRVMPASQPDNFRMVHHYVFAIDEDGCLLFNGKPYYRLEPKTGYQIVSSPSGPVITEVEIMGREKIFIADNQWHHLAVTGFPTGHKSGMSGGHYNSWWNRDALYVVMDGKILPYVAFDKQVELSTGYTPVYHQPFPDGRGFIAIYDRYSWTAASDSEYPEFKWQDLHMNPVSFGNLVGHWSRSDTRDNPAYKVESRAGYAMGLPIATQAVGFSRDPNTGVVTEFMGERWDPTNLPIHVARKASKANGKLARIPKYNMWAQNTTAQFNLVGEMTNILVDGTFAAPIEEIQARYMIGPQIVSVSPRTGVAAKSRLRAFDATIERGPAGPISVGVYVGKANGIGKEPTVLIREPMGAPIWMDVDAGRAVTSGHVPALDLRLAKEIIFKIASALTNFYGLPTTAELSLLTNASASWSVRMRMPNKVLQPTLGGR